MVERRLRALAIASVVATIAVTLSTVWIWAARYNYVPCIADCGETLLAQLQARHFRYFGFEFGLIEDHATSISRKAHPYYYTHNVNLGSLYYVALEALGVHSFAAKQFFVLLVFGMGLFYIYAAVATHTKSRVMGYCVLAAACLDFGFFFAFSLHALRTWSWVALFGLLFHVGRYARRDGASAALDAVVIAVLACIAFGIGYEFWITCICIAILTHYFFSVTPALSSERLRGLAFLVALFFIPFVLRQLHIAMFLGVEYWSRDFVYTFASKVPFATTLLGVPGPEAIDEFYRSHHVLRPPTEPIRSGGEFTNAVLALIVGLFHGTLAQAGSLAMVTTGLACLGAMAIVIAERTRRLNAQFAGSDLLGAAKLLLSLSIGIGLGYLILPRMITTFYVALGMPLLGAVIVVAKGSLLGLLIAALRQRRALLPSHRWAVFLLTMVVVDHAIVQADNIKAARPMDTSWITTVSSRPEATYAVSYYAPVVAGFTSNWVVGIKNGREWDQFEEIASGRAPFRKEDLFWFGERDTDEAVSIYLRPDYWLYFPVDSRTPFIGAEPYCRQDYILSLVADLLSYLTFHRASVLSFAELPGTAPPGSTIAVRLKLSRMAQVGEVSTGIEGTGSPVRAAFNCVSSAATARLVLPEADGTYDVFAVVSSENGNQRVKISLGKIDVKRDAPVPVIPEVSTAQPSVREIIARFPDLPIAARRVTADDWEGYLLIDLRGLQDNAERAAPD